MAYSTQRAVSDGTLQLLLISIEFFDKSEITAYLNSLPTDAFTWATDKSIRFNTPVAAGVEVLVRRTTNLAAPRHVFSLGAQFKDSTLDEDFKQILHIAQEAVEGANVGDIYSTLNMHGNRIINIGDAVDDTDALRLGQYKADALGAHQARVAAEAAATRAGNSEASVYTARDVALSARDVSVTASQASQAAAATSTAAVQEAKASQIAAKASEQAALGYEAASRESATKAKESEIAAAASAASADATQLRADLLANAGPMLGLTGGPVKLLLSEYIRDTVHAGQFGVKADGVQDNASQMAAVFAFLRTKAPYPPRVIWPAGIIKYSASPNLAITNSHHSFPGATLFEYTGTADALAFDGQFSEGNVYNMVWERCLVAAPANSRYAVYSASMHHCHIQARVIGGGQCGWFSKFSVTSVLDVQVTSQTPTGHAWYKGAQPQTGFGCDEMNPGELLSYCTFPNPIVEHCVIGMDFKNAFGSTLFGGTSEGHSSVGVYFRPSAFTNKIIGMDLEENGSHDVYIEGRENALVDVDTNKQITIVGGASNVVRGGYHNAFYIGAGAAFTKLLDFVYNKDGSKQITDLGDRTIMRCLTDRVGQRVHDGLPFFSTVTPTPPMTTVANTKGNPIKVLISAGGTAVEYVRAGGGFVNIGTSGVITVSPGDSLQVYHSGTGINIRSMNA